MSDVFSLTEELSALEHDVQWRRDEISYLRKQESLTRFDPPGSTGNYRNNIYLRLLIPTLYAHHEGYAIRCWDSVYEGIDASGVAPKLLTKELQCLVAQDLLKQIRNFPAIILLDYCNGEKAVLPDIYSFSQQRPVRSDGNLKPGPYCQAFRDLGIEIRLDSEERSLLSQLVDLRNDVVHGRALSRRVTEKFDDFTALVYELQDRSFLATREFLMDAKYLA